MIIKKSEGHTKFIEEKRIQEFYQKIYLKFAGARNFEIMNCKDSLLWANYFNMF